MNDHPVELRGNRFIQRVDDCPGLAPQAILYIGGTVAAGRLIPRQDFQPAPYEEARRWLDQRGG